MTNLDWLAQQTQAFKHLCGRKVLRWPSIEMALLEDSINNEHLWSHESVPMLQLYVLHIAFDDATAIIGTSQNDTLWGLSCALGAAEMELETLPTSIFRTRVLSELPVGTINDVRVVVSDEDIEAVEIVVEGICVSLLAGEIYEQSDGAFAIEYLDESILVQVGGRRPTLHSTEPAQKAAQAG